LVLRIALIPAQLFEIILAVPTLIDGELEALLLLHHDENFIVERFLPTS